MREFIRLQFKLKWGFNRNNSKASAGMTGAIALIAVAIVLALVGFLSIVLKSQVFGATAKNLAVLYLTIEMIGLTVAATGMQIKRLYKPADLLITARFPLSPFKLFVSYLILNYIDLTIYSAVISLPLLLTYGFVINCISASYILCMLLGTILLPIIPFALSIYIAIPTVYISNFLEKHGVVRFIAFIALLVGAFALYYYILTVLAQFFIHRNWEEGTLEIWSGLISGLNKYYNPAYYVGNVIFFDGFWIGLGGLLGAGVVLIAGGVAISKVVSSNIRNNALEGGTSTPRKETKTDDYSSARAMFRYNFNEILHTKTYSYFYLGVAISTPVMVFFCNRLVTMVGEAQVGAGIEFGASMLVIAVFMAMISSFSGTALSVEGKNFYITKLVPVPYRKQLLIKAVLSIGVSAVALIISAIVLCFLKFLNAADMAVLILTQLVLAVGLVFNGINLNLANPGLKLKANGEPEEINITYMLLIGIVIAAGLGTCSIIFPGSSPNGTIIAYIIDEAVAFVYALINFVIFWFTADRKYRKIEI